MLSGRLNILQFGATQWVITRERLNHFLHQGIPYILAELPNTEKSFRNLIKSKPKSDCIYHFPIDLEHNEFPLGSKLIVKW